MRTSFSILSLCMCLMLFSQAPTKGLVLYLPLDGNTNDLSGFSNNGTNYGATPFSNRFGFSNKALYFDGSSYLKVTSSPNIILGNNKTLSCWVYIPSSETQNLYPTIIHKDEPLMSTTYSIMMCESPGYASRQYKFDFIFASNYTHYEAYSKQLYSNYKDKWLHIASTYDSISGYSKVYFNGVLSDSTYVGNKTAHTSNLNLYIGTGKNAGSQQMFKGGIDDLRLYNRALTKNEISQLFYEGVCTSSSKNDTTTYSVASETFKSISPIYKILKIDSLKTKTGGCDSIINRYAKFIYNDKICSPTSISVTDTLIIKLQVSATSTTLLNTLKIYPNPARDNLYINFGDYTKMAGYLLLIRNELGSTVYFTPISQSLSSINIKNWTKGVYLVQVLDDSSNLVDVRKIIIQ